MDLNLAETHTSLGFLEVVLLDFAAAEEHFLRSHQLKPDQALTFWWNATQASSEGRLDEARAMAHQAAQLAPTIPMYVVAEGLLWMYSGMIPQAIDLLQKAFEMNRELPLTLGSLGQALAESGQLEEGIELLRRAAPGMGAGALWARGQLGHYLGRSGDREGALRVLDDLLLRRQTEYVQIVAIAAVYAGLGEHDQAVQWLEEAARQPGALQFWIPIDPLWRPLASYSGFQKILTLWQRRR